MNRTGTFLYRLIFLFAIAAMVQTAGARTTVSRMLCEYLQNPLGIDTPNPRLSWIIDSNVRGQKQTAYQILVAGSEAQLKKGQADLWDSGKVESDAMAQIYYAGKTLVSRQQCFWKVRVWDKYGDLFESKVGRWEMGLLDTSDWSAKWIARTTDTNVTAAPMLRCAFALDGRVRKARAYVTGLGYFDLGLNGKKVDDAVLQPGYTRYDKRVLYLTYDVTDLLKSGTNVIGAVLGNGWYNVPNKAAWDFDHAPWRAAPKLLCQVEVEFTDGRRRTIASGPAYPWKTAESPSVYNAIYSGETYDARREQAGWDKPGFDDTRWDRAEVVEAPQGKLSCQMIPPIRIDRWIKPVSVTEPKPGVFVFDFGQNMAGLAQLKMKGPAGTKVTLRYSERLAKDGNIDTADIAMHVLRYGSNQLFQTDSYTLKGQGTETWNSRFSYYGFRYVEVTGFPGKPGRDALTAAFFHSDVPRVGAFECSNPMLNKVWRAGLWAYLSNLQGIPTDCPHREKNGWTGDAHLSAEQAMFNYFPAAVYMKWLNDLGDEQQADGRLPGIVPTSGWGYKWGNGPAWDSAFLLIPYYQYVYYGDTELFRRHYDGMKRYVDYLATRAKDDIVNIGLNDWAPWKTKTDAAITDTAYYYRDTEIVALAADLLGNRSDARKYRDQAERIKKSFNAKFYQPETGLYDKGSQTALSCALYQGLVEPQNKALVLSNLVAAVEKTDWHIDTGILGAKYLLNALLENNRADVAYRIVAQKTQPGWGWWIEQGATTLWEEWGGGASRNHIMYGDVLAWLHKALAGINPDAAEPGFKHFAVKPHVVGDLTWARAEYDSIHGKIVSDWKVEGGQFRMQIVVPANTTASAYLPISDMKNLKVNRDPAMEAEGVTFLFASGSRTVWKLEPGEYRISGPLSR